MNFLLFAGGLIGLVIGATLLVRGASKLALSFGISPLVVGLTVVAFGTGAPEVAVSVGAVLGGTSDVAVGAVVGSNIFNILLILGLSALITPLVVNSQLIRQEVPIMLGVSLLLVALGLDGSIGMSDAVLMLLLMVAYTVFLIVQSRRETRDAAAEAGSDDVPELIEGAWDSKWPGQLALIAGGLILLVLGSEALVTAAVSFARQLGVSDLIIGLTIVSMGTSLPEVATSITAALKGERDIAVGNVVGSNIFNILGAIGITGLVSNGIGQTLMLPPALLAFDIWVMLAVALACLPVFLSGREIARWEGAVFLGYYVAYVVYLILSAKEHAVLPLYSTAMLSFVIPLTVVTLVASTIRTSEKPGHASAD